MIAKAARLNSTMLQLQLLQLEKTKCATYKHPCQLLLYDLYSLYVCRAHGADKMEMQFHEIENESRSTENGNAEYEADWY